MSVPRVSIVGGAGYVGGELLRLVTDHPHVRLGQVTSASHAGHPVHATHPNLRGRDAGRFVSPDALERCDILFLALPHGEAARTLERYLPLAERIIDCSADFRLPDAARYERWYGEQHPAPGRLGEFVYGLPERRRDALRGASRASGVGCNATVTTLAIAPLADAGLLRQVVADVKVGSSEGGARPRDDSHHPERAGAVRSFKPAGHRHQAEVHLLLGDAFDLSFSVTAIELVRGALVTAHCFLREPASRTELARLYRAAYADEPFVRLVHQTRGIYRLPEPKVLAGSNYCDVGFVVDEDGPGNRVVVVAALDNLMKGAAGSAVQSMNVMMGWPETAGLGFSGLHPA